MVLCVPESEAANTGLSGHSAKKKKCIVGFNAMLQAPV